MLVDKCTNVSVFPVKCSSDELHEISPDINWKGRSRWFWKNCM